MKKYCNENLFQLEEKLKELSLENRRTNLFIRNSNQNNSRLFAVKKIDSRSAFQGKAFFTVQKREDTHQ